MKATRWPTAVLWTADDFQEQVCTHDHLSLNIQCCPPEFPEWRCQSSVCGSQVLSGPESRYRIEICVEPHLNEPPTFQPRQDDPYIHFHIHCLEKMLDLTSSAMLHYITFNARKDTPDLNLDHGAAEILRSWHCQCKWNNQLKKSTLSSQSYVYSVAPTSPSRQPLRR